MAKPAKPDFRASLSAHKPLYMAWLGLGSPLASRSQAKLAGMRS